MVLLRRHKPTISPQDAGPGPSAYCDTVANTAGSASSELVTVTVGTGNATPAFVVQPVSQSTGEGADAVFRIAVTGTPAPTLHWQKQGGAGGEYVENLQSEAEAYRGGATPTLSVSRMPACLSGTMYRGATGDTLSVSGVSASMNRYQYCCTAQSWGGRAASGAATLTVSAQPAPANQLVNISTRAYCSTGDAVTIGGFVVTGPAPKTLLIRAVGPTLASQGLPTAEVLADPVLEVHDADTTPSRVRFVNLSSRACTASSRAAVEPAAPAWCWSKSTTPIERKPRHRPDRLRRSACAVRRSISDPPLADLRSRATSG